MDEQATGTIIDSGFNRVPGGHARVNVRCAKASNDGGFGEAAIVRSDGQEKIPVQ
jgi:hypothetical protein